MLGSNKEMQLKLHMQLNKRSLNIRIKENGHKFSAIRLTFLHEIYARLIPLRLSCATFFLCSLSRNRHIPVIYIKFHINKFYAERAICSFDTLKSINATTPGAAVKMRLNHTNRHQIQFKMEI